jgi:hypothetical protein
VTLLKHDNVVSPTARSADLGITPTSVEAEVPSYLWRSAPRANMPTQARRESSAPVQ